MLHTIHPLAFVLFVTRFILSSVSVPHVVKELAVVYCPVRVSHCSLALHSSLVPLALVVILAGPVQFSWSVRLVVAEPALVFAAIEIGQLALAMDVAIVPGALVVHCGVLVTANSMLLALEPLTIVG